MCFGIWKLLKRYGNSFQGIRRKSKEGNLIFECLAERTVALGQKDKQCNPELGYNQRLKERMVKILPLAKKNHIKVVTNMGAANPEAAYRIRLLPSALWYMNLDGRRIPVRIRWDRLYSPAICWNVPARSPEAAMQTPDIKRFRIGTGLVSHYWRCQKTEALS